MRLGRRRVWDAASGTFSWFRPMSHSTAMSDSSTRGSWGSLGGGGARYVLFAVLGLGLLTVDLVSKRVVFERLGYPNGATEPILNGWLKFRLYTSFNEGALWGIGQGFSWLFAAFSVVAAVAILGWVAFGSAARSTWLTVALAFIFAGTLGNLYDRMGWHGCTDPAGNVRYAVRDFLLFTFGTFHWPVFNFADVFLVTGAMMLVVHSLYMPAVEATPHNLVPQAERSAEGQSHGASAAEATPLGGGARQPAGAVSQPASSEA
ncbi:MAG: signal peptidase II [Planctomycetota bacterium]|nr:MAG: signal peptidase II [Planctomycetota bacterium]